MSRNRLGVVVRAEVQEVDSCSAVTHGDLGNCYVFGNSFKMEYTLLVITYFQAPLYSGRKKFKIYEIVVIVSVAKQTA